MLDSGFVKNMWELVNRWRSQSDNAPNSNFQHKKLGDTTNERRGAYESVGTTKIIYRPP